MTTEPIPLKKGRRRKRNKKERIVNWFKTIEARISWIILSTIDVVIVAPYQKLFPPKIVRCSWCKNSEEEDLTIINGYDYNQPPIAVCTDVSSCSERYWSKDY